MRLTWSAALAGRYGSSGIRALAATAALSVSCSGGDEFTTGAGATGGSSGTAGSPSGGAGGSNGSGGRSGAGGTSGAGGASGAGGTSGAAGTSGSGGTSGADGGGSGGTSGSAGSAGAGAGGTGGTGAGGNGGTSGSAGAGGTSGSAGTGGNLGSGGGTSCRWSDPSSCPTGQFCNALGCVTGICMPVPAEGSQKNPVCGCDGINYWNASVAAHRGMSAEHAGECVPGTTCAGFGGLECPNTAAVCNMQISDLLECDGSDLGGKCWILPATCPDGPGFGPITRACDAAGCTPECQLIKAGEPWYRDNTCPQ